MYHSTGVGKLSETQKSKLRNGHPVRIKAGSGNKLHLTDPQIRKLQSAHKRGAAYTLTMHPEQAEKHGEGFFGDIASKAKAFARKHKDLINPIINRVKSTVHGGIDKLSNKAKEKLEELIQPIEGEGVKRRRGRPKKGAGVIGDVLKGLISTTGLGVVKPKRLKKEGKGFMTNLIKSVAPGAIDAIANAASNAAKGQVEAIGSGAKRKAGRPRKGRGGGALFPAGNYGPND